MKQTTPKALAVPVLLAALTVVGSVIRLRMEGQDLFADELATYWIVSTRGLEGVVRTVSTTAEITPPLGFMLSWFGSRVELTPEWVRLPALISGVLTIPLVYALGQRVASRAAGLFAASFTAFSPFMVYYSAEARGYGVMMLLVLLSTLSLLLAIEGGRRRWWFAYGLFIALAAYTHYTSVFVLAAQFGWAWLAHPASRKYLLIATGVAACVYLPWLPSLKGDLDSPTTLILAGLSPFTLHAVGLSLIHWLVGFPYSNVLGIGELPGPVGIVLLVAGLVSAIVALWLARASLRERLAGLGSRLWLIALLAVATPIGTALASAVSTDMLSTRNLAASWPFLAVLLAALIAAGEARVRIAAATLIAAGLAVGSIAMTMPENQRPDFSGAAAYVQNGPRGVVVDAASFTPGPLANFDVAGSDPGGPVFRLNIPEQKRVPFNFSDTIPDPADISARAVEAAGDGPITLVVLAGEGLRGAGFDVRDPSDRFTSELPDGWRETERVRFPGFFPLDAITFERAPAADPGPAKAAGSGGSG